MKKIALIVDVKDWAFDIGAKILKNAFKDEYQMDIYASKDYDDNLFKLLEVVKDYDLIHFFWRKLLLQFDSNEFIEELKNNNYDYNDYLKICNKITTAVFDHLFLEGEERKSFINVYNKYSRGYYTCSKRLENIYKAINEYKKPWGTVHENFDPNLYTGGDRNRFSKTKDYLTIGWVGNSNWNVKVKDYKGFHTILNPVLDELISEGYNIKKHFADKNIKFRTSEEMPSYYQEIDICVVTSMVEGTPRPAIEAMASGVPIIATDVGVIPEILGPKEQKFIIGSRTDDNDLEIKAKLKEKIIEIYNHKYLLEELSKENYEYSKYTSIDYLKDTYKKFFESFMN